MSMIYKISIISCRIAIVHKTTPLVILNLVLQGFQLLYRNRLVKACCLFALRLSFLQYHLLKRKLCTKLGFIVEGVTTTPTRRLDFRFFFYFA